MRKRDLTEFKARTAARAARRRTSELYGELEMQRGPKRTEDIYRLLSEVRKISDEWRKETTLSKLYLRKQLNILAGREYKVDRPPEFMLLRISIPDRQVYSAWAKVTKFAHKHKVSPGATARWITDNGGIDNIIRKGILLER